QPVTHVREQVAIDRRRWRTMFVVVMLLGLGLSGMAWSTAPEGTAIAFAVLVATMVTSFVHPFVGVYVIVFVTLVGDSDTMPWWPFTKNLSSRESILFVSDSLPINPMEILLIAAFGSFLLQRLEDPTWRFKRGGLFIPLVVFTGFVVFGFLRGVSGGGDRRVAIFESRAMFYLFVVYLLVTNLLTSRRQYQRLVLLALVAVSINSLFALSFYFDLSPDERETLEGLAQHTAAIHMNVLFVFILTMLLLKGSRLVTAGAIVLALPVFFAYFLSQRRSAIVALVIGVIVLMAVVYFKRRRAFWFFTPTAVVLGVGFLAATWNARGALGLASSAVKSIIAPDDLAEAERNSNVYREIEAFDLNFTIQQSPLTGQGFGRKFLMPSPLPDISFFEFWEYIPHNSVLYVWIKTGFLGFVAFLFLFARALQLGGRSALLVKQRDQATIVLAGLIYVAMFLVFSYVDIAWDVRSTVFLAVSFALCADYLHLPDVTPGRFSGIGHHRRPDMVQA
ncbi:MAG: O-antigen ligase family protein, partial [Ilumatobacteraceae bacterium]